MAESPSKDVLKFDGYSEFIIAHRYKLSTYPEHWHLTAEFYLVDTCEQIWKISDTTYHLHPGDVVLVWPSELHEVIEGNNGDVICIKFGCDLITRCHDINMNYLLLTKMHLIDESWSALNPILREGIQAVMKIQEEHPPLAETRARIKIEEMLLAICEQALHTPEECLQSAGTANETYLKIKQACAYITENCDRDLSQADVAELSGFSTYYFSRVFKKYSNESFSEFLNRSRIRKAVRLLRISDIPVTEIAFSAGFQSISNFNKVFRSTLGCSPLEYRKLYNSEHMAAPPSDSISIVEPVVEPAPAVEDAAVENTADAESAPIDADMTEE